MEIDGKALRDRRRQAGLSIEAAVAILQEEHGLRLNERTIRRAERSGRCDEDTLTALSRLYHADPASFARTAAPITTLRPGVWSALYLEGEDDGTVFWVEERLELTLTGDRIAGRYTSVASGHPDADVHVRHFGMKGTVAGRIVQGTYWPEQGHWAGEGHYLLKIMRGGYYCEGFCAFAGQDGDIATSFNIWLHHELPQFAVALTMAKERMLDHRHMWLLTTDPV